MSTAMEIPKNKAKTLISFDIFESIESLKKYIKEDA